MFNEIAAWFVVANIAAGAWIIVDSLRPDTARRRPGGRELFSRSDV